MSKTGPKERRVQVPFHGQGGCRTRYLHLVLLGNSFVNLLVWKISLYIQLIQFRFMLTFVKEGLLVHVYTVPGECIRAIINMIHKGYLFGKFRYILYDKHAHKADSIFQTIPNFAIKVLRALIHVQYISTYFG